MPIRTLSALLISFCLTTPLTSNSGLQNSTFDHTYATYGRLLRGHVVDTRVDYTTLKQNRSTLDEVVQAFSLITESDFTSWSTPRQLAFLINAYNIFTLQVIIDHYPIERRWFDFWNPANSIKQIPGVWSTLRWQMSGTQLTLDDIEHNMLRRNYAEPRIHFAVNCAAISCPPLKSEPYVDMRLERQLALATRDFLASDNGIRVEDDYLHVSRLFDWYGNDFVADYANLVEVPGTVRDRAIAGIIAKYGPSAASQVAQSGRAQIRFLPYDWSLNDLPLSH
ncbi:MAG: DUF547 domain-containing protein [Acidobacteriota bacterium]|nr:DUF547 domain-containing protein [Acidobacteriota bacterium]